jgi:hypothetical protein
MALCFVYKLILCVLSAHTNVLQCMKKCIDMYPLRFKVAKYYVECDNQSNGFGRLVAGVEKNLLDYLMICATPSAS